MPRDTSVETMLSFVGATTTFLEAAVLIVAAGGTARGEKRLYE